MYKGYVDDPRNTDNAWMETVAVNFHDDTGEIFSEFKLQVSCFCIGTPGRWEGRERKPLLICKPTTTFFGRKVFLFIYLLPHTHCLDTWTLAYRSLFGKRARVNPPPPPPPPPQSLNETPFFNLFENSSIHIHMPETTRPQCGGRESVAIFLFLQVTCLYWKKSPKLETQHFKIKHQRKKKWNIFKRGFPFTVWVKEVIYFSRHVNSIWTCIVLMVVSYCLADISKSF